MRELKLPSALERKQQSELDRQVGRKVKQVRERLQPGRIVIDEWSDVEWHPQPGGVFRLDGKGLFSGGGGFVTIPKQEFKGDWQFTPEEPKDPTDEWLENYKKENL